MKKIRIIFILILIVFAMVSCSYSFNMNSMPYVKTIKIEMFENKTSESLIEEELFKSLSDYFLRDGRLKVVNIGEDSRLEGSIISYRDFVTNFDDEENVEVREVEITFKIKFRDLKKNEITWENENLKISKKYNEQVTYPNYATSEETAREEIYNELFDKLLEKTLEKW